MSTGRIEYMSKTLLKTVSLAAVAGILAFSPVQDAQAKKM